MKKIKFLTIITGLLVIFTSIISIVMPDVYSGFVEGDYIAESIGQDFISAASALVLIFVCLRGSDDIRFHLIKTGLFMYMVYAYAIYAFGAVYNYLFFNYLAVIGLSVFCGFYSVGKITTYAVSISSFPVNFKNTGYRASAVFLFCTAVLLVFIWGSSVIESIIRIMPARENVIYVLDLSLVLPLFVFAAIKVFLNRSSGVFLTVLSMVKALTLGVSVVSGQAVRFFNGYEMNWFLACFFTLFTLAALVLFINLHSPHHQARNSLFVPEREEL